MPLATAPTLLFSEAESHHAAKARLELTTPHLSWTVRAWTCAAPGQLSHLVTHSFTFLFVCSIGGLGGQDSCTPGKCSAPSSF